MYAKSLTHMHAQTQNHTHSLQLLSPLKLKTEYKLTEYLFSSLYSLESLWLDSTELEQLNALGNE